MSLPGDSTYTLLYHYFGYGDETRVVYVPADGTVTENVQLQTSPVGWVSGVVYDHLGNPAPEATVKVLDTPLEPVDTAPDGSYTIELPGNASYDLQAWAEGSGTQTVTDVNITPGNTTIVDFNLPLDPIYLPTPPDGYGYMIYDMHDAGGPGYTWNSIAGVGTPISLSDDSYQNLTCSFSFGFYGTTYNSMTVGSNGFITPGTNGYTNYANSCIPNSYVPGSVYPHWDDINPASGGNIYYYDDTANHRFIVEFNAVPYFSNSGTVTMQIVCLDPAYYPTPTGDAQWLIYYNNLGTINSCTVGIINPAGDDGVQYLCNGLYHENASPITDEFAILITTGTLAEDPVITFAPEVLDLGDIYLGYTETVNYSILNMGLGQLEVTDIIPSSATLVPQSTSFSITGGGFAVNTLEVTPTALGAYSETLTHVNNTDNPNAQYSVIANVVFAPSLAVDPTSVVYSLPVGDTGNTDLAIINNGDGTLDWSIEVEDLMTRHGDATVVPPPGTITTPSQVVEFDDPKDLPQATAPRVRSERNSGEDLTGTYSWRDSFEPGGPVFDWLEINPDLGGPGTDLGLYADDSYLVITLPFSFEFYGVVSDQLNIGTNGALSTTYMDYITLSNSAIPNTSNPNGVLAAFWDDLDGGNGDGAAIYTYHDSANQRFIVEYYFYPYYPNGDNNTFQVILYENGRILYQYQTVPNVGSHSQTVGIESPDGTDGIQIYYNGSGIAPENGYAVEFYAYVPWVGVDVNSGTTAPHSQDLVPVWFDATELVEGTYYANLHISSNDPDQNLLTVPVTLNVGECADLINVSITGINPPVLSISGGSPGNSYLIYRSSLPYDLGGTPVATVPVNSDPQEWIDSSAPPAPVFYQVIEDCGSGSRIIRVNNNQ